jgi:hypothetical protein
MSETIPPPPRKSASAQAFDILLWGGVIALLVVSFKPAEIDKFPQLFTEAGRMREFASGFFAPFTDAKAVHVDGLVDLYRQDVADDPDGAVGHGPGHRRRHPRWACWARATSRRCGSSSRCAGRWT